MPGDELLVPRIPAKDGEPLPSDIDISKRPLGHVTAGDRFCFDKQKWLAVGCRQPRGMTFDEAIAAADMIIGRGIIR